MPHLIVVLANIGLASKGPGLAIFSNLQHSFLALKFVHHSISVMIQKIGYFYLDLVFSFNFLKNKLWG
jgi:hypothetical protein